MKTFSHIANDCCSAHPVSQPGPLKHQEGDKQLQPIGDKNPGRADMGEDKGFILTQNRYCTSLHKRALGQEQLTYSCCGRYTALSYCVYIYAAGRYLGGRTLLSDFFRLESKCCERYVLGNQGQIILLKLFTVQMRNQKNQMRLQRSTNSAKLFPAGRGTFPLVD